MIRRSAGCFGVDPAKPKLGQIELIDEDIYHPNGIVLIDPVFKAFGKQCGLTAIHSLAGASKENGFLGRRSRFFSLWCW